MSPRSMLVTGVCLVAAGAVIYFVGGAAFSGRGPASPAANFIGVVSFVGWWLVLVAGVILLLVGAVRSSRR